MRPVVKLYVLERLDNFTRQLIEKYGLPPHVRNVRSLDFRNEYHNWRTEHLVGEAEQLTNGLYTKGVARGEMADRAYAILDVLEHRAILDRPEHPGEAAAQARNTILKESDFSRPLVEGLWLHSFEDKKYWP